MRFLRFGVVLLGLTIGLVSCRSGDAPSKSSNQPGTPGAAPGSAPHEVSWFRGAAPLILVPGRTPDRSMIALADTDQVEAEGALLDSNATFIRLDGTTTSGRVAITQSAEGCTEAAIEPAPSTGWGAGFIGGAPAALRVDSLRAMSRQDSSALTRTAFRLASTVPNGPGSRFSGLAFVMVGLWRVKLPDGNTAVVAALRRQINQEDSPLQERTFIIAETDSLESDGYSLAYAQRSSGPEETVESRELLAAVTFPGSPVEFIVAHDFGDENSYGIVERAAPRKWNLRWMSRRFSC